MCLGGGGGGDNNVMGKCEAACLGVGSFHHSYVSFVQVIFLTGPGPSYAASIR